MEEDKKSQINRTCQRCRARKRICGPGTPCPRCRNAGVPDECVRLPTEKRGPKGPHAKKKSEDGTSSATPDSGEGNQARGKKGRIKLERAAPKMTTSSEEDSASLHPTTDASPEELFLSSPSHVGQVVFQNTLEKRRFTGSFIDPPRFPPLRMMSPTLPEIPSFVMPAPEIVNLCIELHFTWTEVLRPMLHRDAFGPSRQVPNLLLYGILLSTPLKTPWVPVPGATGQDAKQWERTWFRAAKSELFALLGQSRQEKGDSKAVAAVMLLEAWAQAKGLNALSRKLLWLAEELLVTGGFVVDGLSMEPVPQDRSWEAIAERAAGSDFKTQELPVEKVMALRTLWIDFWTRHRVAQAVFAEKWHRRDHDRDLEQFARFPISALNRLILPSYPVWQASIDHLFDPRAFASPTTKVIDYFPFFGKPVGDMSRDMAPITIPFFLAAARDASYWTHLIFRAKIDAFLLACVAAGLITPGTLPEDPQAAESPELATLALRRNILDADLKAVYAALPPDIKAALESPSAVELVACRTPVLGSFDIASAEVQYLLLFVLLRLEIHMGHGIAAREAALRDSELLWTTRHEIIAEEFSRGGVTSELVDTALKAIRLWEQWSTISPLHPYLSPYSPFGVKIFTFHLVLYRRFRKAPEAADVFASINRDAHECIRIVDTFRPAYPWSSNCSWIMSSLFSGKLDPQRLTSTVTNADAGEEGEELGSVLASYRMLGVK